MSFETKSYEDGTYLVYKVGDGKIDEREYKTIANNDIDGVFKMSRESEDGEESFYIEVTSKTPLNLVLDRPVKKAMLIGIVKSIAESVMEAEEYTFLKAGHFVFDFEHIYVDVSQCKANLIYLPIVRDEEELNPKDFLRSMMFGLRYDLSEDCNYVACLINKLNDKSNFSFESLLEVAKEIENKDKQEKNAQPARSSQAAVREIPSGTPSATSVSSGSASGNADISGHGSIEHKNSSAGSAADIPSKSSTVSMSGIPDVISPKEKEQSEKKGGFLSNLLGKKAKSDEDDSAKGTKRPAPVPTSSRGGIDIPGSASSGINIPGAGSNGAVNIPGGSGSGINIPGLGFGSSKEKSPEKSEPQRSVQSSAPAEEQKALGAEYGRTVLIGGAAKERRTELRKGTDPQNMVARIKRVKTNEVTPINSDTFKIGSEQGLVDLWVSGNNSVSGIHAIIERNGSDYTIQDINSRNHTYLGRDLKELKPQYPYPLRDGIPFNLSDEEFIFILK